METTTIQKYKLYSKFSKFLLDPFNKNDLFKDLLYSLSEDEKYQDIKDDLFALYNKYNTKLSPNGGNIIKSDIDSHVSNILNKEVGYMLVSELL